MNAEISTDPLENLAYFAEWGHPNWINLLKYAFENSIGYHLEGQRILEIGTRYGKMASLFALLGGSVTAVDIDTAAFAIAKAEVARWGVSDRVSFVVYNGNPDIFPDETFDLIFTKSVLVVVPQLEIFLQKLNKKLRSNAKVVFIENGRGNILLHSLRAIRHRHWNHKSANYLTNSNLAFFKDTFDITTIKKTWIPPIYLISGRKKLQQ